MRRIFCNQDLLNRILSLQYGKLTPNQLLKLRERLEAIHDAHPMGLTVGTGCSGSEVIMLVLSKLADVWRSTFGISTTFQALAQHRIGALEAAVDHEALLAGAFVHGHHLCAWQ